MAALGTLLVFLSCFCSAYGSFPPKITSTHFLRDSETFVSNNTRFKIGFFSPSNSINRYVGIWYNQRDSEALQVIWVANRDRPLKDSSGMLKMSDDGNLQLLNGQNKIIWTSNVSVGVFSSTTAQLQDTGNLVLLSNASSTIVWQSFDHPTDTMLANMELYIDETTNEKREFTSWKSPSDPSRGRFTLGIKPGRLSEVFVWDGDRPHVRTGPWVNNILIGVPKIYSQFLASLENNQGIFSLEFPPTNQSQLIHLVMSSDGLVNWPLWDVANRKWVIVWRYPEYECQNYGKCGPFGSCNSKSSPICGCLKGFVPKNKEEWDKGNWTSGCVRITPLHCDTIGGRTDGFLKIRSIRVPDNAVWLSSDDQEGCGKQCLGICSCLAYAYYSGIGCMIWNGSLIDTQETSTTTGVDLFIRLAHSELGAGNSKIILIVLIIMGTTAFAITYCLWRWMGRFNAGNRVTSKRPTFFSNMSKSSASSVEFQDLPLFKFENLVNATNNFQKSNKLGQGGFGSVYKGKLEDGQEIAVKRLSIASGQGLQEFMNEVVLISKLQHVNLVRLLGCCVDGGEKMLVYEYIPNKSLDAFLFDPLHRDILDWKKRFHIIKGICRGLLYLHRDSRLRIIHRDLKAGNILLDEDLNPKISDFGMAKIFGRKEDQASTQRVVGTYGYMSPEYAMEGRFSEKSDVFSFGVLLLEIVSGRRVSTFDDDECLGLKRYAWKLWNEGNILLLIDPVISDPCFQVDILRCLQLGLLCVQDFPEDRPTVSAIISMLHCEITDLPHPMQPRFTQSRSSSSNEVFKNGQKDCSANQVSFTSITGR